MTDAQPAMKPERGELSERGRSETPTPNRGWSWMDLQIGVIPLPVYGVLVAVIGYFVYAGQVPTEISVMVAVLAVCGFGCAELGKRLPILRSIGGAAILATFLPSYLTYAHWIPESLIKSVTDFTKSTNFLYLFITAIIVGSVFGMDRRVLLRGFVRIFLPLAAGSVAALVVGTAVGTALGLGLRHSLLFVVIPVMAGGVGEGAIPLSLGYSSILHQSDGELFAQVLPAVMFGSLTAILLAGALDLYGRRRPDLSGQGRLQAGEQDELALQAEGDSPAVEVTQVAAAAILAISLYMVGMVIARVIGLPAPVAMLFLAVAVKLSSVVTPRLQNGSLFVFQFFAKAVTYPLLFAIGVAMTPWDKLIAALAPANLITIIATVSTLVGTGFLSARWARLYPIDTAIVTACHCGQGGTGSVAILTAANRMQLMPFAQIATRIGGAITVTLTLIVLSRLT